VKKTAIFGLSRLLTSPHAEVDPERGQQGGPSPAATRVAGHDGAPLT
jgi:hypothetical protein